MGKRRVDSDEYYVLDICDEVLEEKGIHQYKFPFLRGDTGILLNVDIFYPNRNIVIEYREIQHYKDVPFFDKPEKLTASGVSRDVQRKIYDKRREEILPQHGIEVIIIPYFKLDAQKGGKLNRNHTNDKVVIENILKKYINKCTIQ